MMEITFRLPIKVKKKIIVLISSNAEWRALCELVNPLKIKTSPFGEWFTTKIADSHAVLFFHGGWGKISAAASTQYVIDRWSPTLLINLGTCGGFQGEISRGTIILVDKTIVYDIIEQMGDYDTHIAHYSVDIDLSWLKGDYPLPVVRTLLVSGDRDLLPEELPSLKRRYRAVAGDWESGAIAWVAKCNAVRLLILRGVTDLVGKQGSEAYGNIQIYQEATRGIFQQLLISLPKWIDLSIQ